MKLMHKITNKEWHLGTHQIIIIMLKANGECFSQRTCHSGKHWTFNGFVLSWCLSNVWKKNNVFGLRIMKN